jgi:16S rRNA (guanine(966)-N(2))-methyltransferase RsmD
MRVITGTAGGIVLDAPKGLTTRPTLAKVKEAIFSSLQFEIHGAYVLDLFAGSGQMGIEALSRGAASCVFVDTRDEALAAVKANLVKTKLRDNAKIVLSDAFSFLKSTNNTFDIVFIDAPYNGTDYQSLLQLAAAVTKNVIVCEISNDTVMPEIAGTLTLTKRKTYGKTAVSYYRKLNVD